MKRQPYATVLNVPSDEKIEVSLHGCSTRDGLLWHLTRSEAQDLVMDLMSCDHILAGYGDAPAPEQRRRQDAAAAPFVVPSPYVVLSEPEEEGSEELVWFWRDTTEGGGVGGKWFHATEAEAIADLQEYLRVVKTNRAALAALAAAPAPVAVDLVGFSALDVVSRALAVIETSEGADEHHELLTELRAMVASLALPELRDKKA